MPRSCRSSRNLVPNVTANTSRPIMGSFKLLSKRVQRKVESALDINVLLNYTGTKIINDALIRGGE
jgi:hypothetical protein